MKQIILIGSPNSGKSLLFNKLTGLNHKVANFPGITVDVSAGKVSALPECELLDFPGAYSLTPISGEEKIAAEKFHLLVQQHHTEKVLCILDATRLEKSLQLALDVIQVAHDYDKEVIVLANMIDVFEKHQIKFDCEGLADALGVPVIGISAKSGLGIPKLIEALDNKSSQNKTLGSSNTSENIKQLSEKEKKDFAFKLCEKFGPKIDLLLKTTNRLDDFFLHSFLGGFAFFGIMFVLFQSIFTWASPVMDGIETLLALMADQVVPLLPNQHMKNFMADAIFGGLGAFLVFVPQIFVLTFIVGLLEDTGYMARAALICHRPLRIFGLTGKSFIPMLSGVACAIPGIYAARNIDSPRKRFLTYLAIPLMPCSARLPVYTLLIAAFIPEKNILGGLLGLQGLAMFIIYFFGLITGLLVTALVSRSHKDYGGDLPFVLEMPPYRAPSWFPLLRNSWNRCKHFLTKAGSVIFTVTVIVWILGYFPNYGADLGQSWLGSIGRFIEPVFAPLGLDWRYGVAIIASFLAREVFVGTLGAIFGIEGADENYVPLADYIQESGLALGSGFALLVFYAIALQCVSTLAVLNKETGSLKLPALMFASYMVLAYSLAFVVFQFIEWI
jgi:ferrous iron transport protein B